MKVSRVNILITVIVLILFTKLSGLETCKEISDNTKEYSRSDRAVLFPVSSTVGILIAVTVPLALPHRNVFFSYNFETNYNSPYLASQYIPGILTRLDISRRDGDTEAKSEEIKRKKKKKYKKRKIGESKRDFALGNFINRTTVYKFLEEKFAIYDGIECLKKMICETVHTPIAPFNGLIGDVVQIILSPSTSIREQSLDRQYYLAEKLGHLGVDCNIFYKKCNNDIYELISILQDIS